MLNSLDSMLLYPGSFGDQGVKGVLPRLGWIVLFGRAVVFTYSEERQRQNHQISSGQQ